MNELFHKILAEKLYNSKKLLLRFQNANTDSKLS